MYHRPWSYLRGGLAAGTTALVLTMVSPVDGAAQQNRRIIITDLPLVEQTRIRAEAEAGMKKASELRSQARAADKAGNFRKAAQLYEESGRLRTAGEALGIEAFELAGRAYYFGDQPRRASRAWEEAANRGLVLGNVFGASLNYMRAAVAAQDAGNQTRAVELGWKAYHLTQSPQLSKSQRAELRQHLQVSGG